MLTLAFRIQPVTAYKSGSGKTHEFIFEQAKTILRNDGYVSYGDFLDSVDPADPYGRTYLQVMIAGSDDHDKSLEFPYVFPWDWYCFNHYMDPTDHHPLSYMGLGFKSAGQLCQERFDEAVIHWGRGESHEAMYDLGWAAHLAQDVCVPHHAYPTWQQGHSTYEDWVLNNMASFAVESGGMYSLPSFLDYQFYTPRHFVGVNASAFDWVDYNTHESIKYWGSVNYYGTNTGTTPVVNDWVTDDYFVETMHNLPNGVSTTWVIKEYQASQMQVHFTTIDMEQNWDYIYIYDKSDNLVASYTGKLSDVLTPVVLGNTLKISVVTDASIQSWGYKTDQVKFYDVGDVDDLEGATNYLLANAQRTTAGFIKFFFDRVLNPVYIRSDGSVDPPTAPIQRNGDVYTFTSNIFRPVVVEKDNIVINGDGRTLQATYNVGDGFCLSGRNNVTIQNAIIKNFWAGVFVWNSTNITLNNNTLVDNEHSIKLHHSSNCSISENLITGYDCIRLVESSNNNIHENNITAFGWGGIVLEHSSNYNSISGNNLINKTYGIYFNSSSNLNSIYENNITDSLYGIELYSSSHNSIMKNNIMNNTYGVHLYISSNNSIYGNNITENTLYGVLFSYSSYNSITINTIMNNNWIGGSFSESSNNVIYHNNFVNNTYQIITNSVNVWDDGYPSGGNYWSDYIGVDRARGPYQDDPGSDGRGDTPYIINANNMDRYPLMNPLSVHNTNTGLRYATIQEAINAKETLDGHIIFVKSGVYCENLVVNKTVSLIGENNTTTIIDGLHWLDTVAIVAHHVIISDFTITGSGWWHSGLLLGGSNCSLFNNIIKNNYIGIWLEFSSNNTFRNNYLIGNGRALVFLGQKEPSDFINDMDTSNIVDGNPIYYWVNRENDEVPSGAGYVALVNSTNITVRNMHINNGILLAYTTNSLVTGCNLKYNGIILIHSSSNALINNTIAWNWYGYGIMLEQSFNNTIAGNNVTNNYYGICLRYSSNNSIYHNNFVNNAQQVDFYRSLNAWDYGYPSGGNYWSDYQGVDLYRGPYQNETGSDRIGDTPYVIADNTDRYPLMNPWTPPDIAVMNVTPSKTIIGQGFALSINVTVTNQGNKIEGFNITAYVNTTAIQTQYITLTSGTSTLTFTWNTTGFAKGNYTIWAYAWPVQGETYTSDNTLPDGWVIVAMVGDVNGPEGWPDGKVDMMYDIRTVAKLFGVAPPDPKYIANYDINGDGQIDMINDIRTVAKQFGKTDP
jgi:parallel beta-helix repeat protein